MRVWFRGAERRAPDVVFGVICVFMFLKKHALIAEDARMSAYDRDWWCGSKREA